MSELKPGQIRAVLDRRRDPKSYVACCGACRFEQAIPKDDPISMRGELVELGWKMTVESGWICAACRVFMESVQEKVV